MFRFTFKNMKKVWRSHKLVILLVLAFLIIIPAIVFGVDPLNTWPGGYQTLHGQLRKITDLASISRTNTCVTNSTANDYFIPTKTATEWDAFLTNKPSGVTTGACCGDLICNNGETYASCNIDCPAPTCSSASNCGTNGWESYRWSWPNIYGRYRTYSCTSGACSNVLAAETTVATCSQGWAPNSNTFSCYQQYCAGGKYSHDGVCTDCAAGVSTFAGYNTSCAACPAGYYSYGNVGSACTYCPNNYVCFGGTNFQTCDAVWNTNVCNGTCGELKSGWFSSGGCSTFDNCCYLCAAGTWVDHCDVNTGLCECGPCTRNYWCSGGGTRNSCGTGYYSATSSDAVTDCYSL